MQTIDLGYRARGQFVDFHRRRQRWSVLVFHRRAGKTVACVADLIDAALRSTKTAPRFAYVAPFFVQAKTVAWDYVKRFTSAIPGAQFNEAELRVDLPNGARITLYGADNYQRLRGIYLDGVVLDEVGDMDPRAWSEVIRPALADRKGWAVFIGTPRGRNHFSDVWDQAQNNAEWFATMGRASETGLIDPDELEAARREMTPEQFAAEFECSFNAAVIGSYYGSLIEAAERDGRVSRVPIDPRSPVHTAWDLGIGDSTAIWLFQCIGVETRIIDYIEHAGVGLDWYASQLRERGHNYGTHLLPHDAGARELGTGRSRVEVLATLGIKSDVISAQSVADGINAVRTLLPTCWFDHEKTKRGVEALRQYRRQWDEKRKAFNERPYHDWTSHPADAFRILALGRDQVLGASKPANIAAIIAPKFPRLEGSWLG